MARVWPRPAFAGTADAQRRNPTAGLYLSAPVVRKAGGLFAVGLSICAVMCSMAAAAHAAEFHATGAGPVLAELPLDPGFGATAVAGSGWQPGFNGLIVAAAPGRIASIRPAVSGFAHSRTTVSAVPQLVRPSAVVRVGDTALVADPSANRVEALRLARGDRWRLSRQLAVGEGPIDLAVLGSGDFHPDVVVACSGSDQVVLLRNDGHDGFAVGQSVTVGGGPLGLIATSLGDFDLAVADAGARAVTLLKVGARDVLGGRRDVAVPGAVGAIAAFNGGLIVGDPDAGRLTVMIPGPAASPLLAVGSVALPAPLATGSLRMAGGTFAPDRVGLAVAAPGGVAVFLKARSGLRPAAVVAGSAAPVTALVARDLGGDDLDDLLVLRDGQPAADLLVTLGDRLVADRPAENLRAGDGLLVWSRRQAPRRYVLMALDHGVSAPVPVAASERPFAADVGRDARNHTVLTYVRCGGRRCRAYSYRPDARVEHPLSLPRQVGCQPGIVVQWGRATAYTLAAPARSHRCRVSGTWERIGNGRPRRLDRDSTLGDIDHRRVTWIDFRRHRTIGRVRIAALGGRAHTIASLQLGRDEVDAFQLAEAQLSGNNGYWVDWTAYGGFVHTDVHRYTGLGHHVHTILFDLYNDVGDQGGVPHVAADGNRLYYVGRRGIYLAAPARLHCQCGQHDEQG